MTNVYAWPPVGLVAAEWSQIAPIGRSRSLLTGGSYVSAAQRRRKVASIDVSVLSRDANGAGYMEVLKRLLDGGVHLVRLYSTPINWHLHDSAENAARSRPMSWIVPADALMWTTGGSDLPWWDRQPTQGVASGDGLSITVTGLPAREMVARPGEFVSMGGKVAMVVRPAQSNSQGVANLRVITPLEGSGPIVIGARETAVFEADAMPRAVQPLGANWTYSWTFTEVFEDERGPFAEVDPWS